MSADEIEHFTNDAGVESAGVPLRLAAEPILSSVLLALYQRVRVLEEQNYQGDFLWVLTAETKHRLLQIRDGLQQRFFYDELSAGFLLGHRVTESRRVRGQGRDPSICGWLIAPNPRTPWRASP